MMKSKIPSTGRLEKKVPVRLSMKNPAGRNIIMPDGLVFYGKNGETWVYIPIKPQTYLRHPIQVEDIKGNSAVLNDGSHIGSNVVSPGGSALLGSELENKPGK